MPLANNEHITHTQETNNDLITHTQETAEQPLRIQRAPLPTIGSNTEQ